MKNEIKFMVILIAFMFVAVTITGCYVMITRHNITEGYIMDKGVWGKNIMVYEDDKLVKVITYEDTQFWFQLQSGKDKGYVIVSQNTWNYYNIGDYYQGNGR